MVAGMAMAISFTADGASGLAPKAGTKHQVAAAGVIRLNLEGVAGGNLVRETFTPLHTGELSVGMTVYGMIVWRHLAPRRIAETSSPASDKAVA